MSSPPYRAPIADYAFYYMDAPSSHMDAPSSYMDFFKLFLKL
jgi:hypothetical protein